ncbi:MAG: hypothetical protein O3A36_03740 [bacterium]|nr:hypothetical protein [bacterium]
MKILLQDIVPSQKDSTTRYDKIVMMNGEYFYPHEQPQNEYHEFVLHALDDNVLKNSSWKVISTHQVKNSIGTKKQILEHVTRSRNILCSTSDGLSALHHSSYILNSNSEITLLSSQLRAQIIKNIYEYSSQGNSVLGVAIKKIESKSSNTQDVHNGIFIALVLRKYILQKNESITADKRKKLNIEIKVFSKELLPACKWYARKIGVHASDDFCITSDALQSMDDTELSNYIHHTNIFAQMRPMDLQRVSRLYAIQGHELIN